MLYKFEEYDDFVLKYSLSLGKENKEIVEKLAKSNYYFYKFEEKKDFTLLGEIQKISSSLHHINGKLTLNLALRTTLCKTYLELSLIDNSMSQLVDNEIIAFKSFIKRKKINEEKVLTYSKFFTILSELNKLVQKPDKKAKVKLLKRINKLMPFGNSTYLLQKIENL